MRGYFYYWFSCGQRALRCMCFCNGITFSIKKVKKIEISFLDMKEFLDRKEVESYCYQGKTILYDNSILQTNFKGQNHFIYLIKKFSKYCFIYDSAKLIVFRLRKRDKVLNSWTGYQLTLKRKIRLKRLVFKIFFNLLTLIEVQMFIFILKIVLNML